jgi:proline racemase
MARSGTTISAAPRRPGHTTVDGLAAVITEIAGTAFETGRSTFVLDPRDPLGTGFLLR